MTEPDKLQSAPQTTGRRLLEFLLLALCLAVLAIRTTITESPTAQSGAFAADLDDSLYSVTLSALLVLAFTVYLVDALLARTFRWRITGIEIGLALFIIAAIASWFTAANKRLAVTAFANLLAPPLAALLLAQLLDTPAKIKVVLCVIAALAVVSAFKASEQYFLSNQITIEQYESDPASMLEPLGIEPGSFQQFLFEHRLYSHGVRAFFTTRNSAASFLLPALFVAAALLVEKIRNRKPDFSRSAYMIAPAFATAAIALSLALTRSKGALLGLLAAVLVAFLLLRKGSWIKAHRRLLLILLIIAASLLTTGVAFHGLRHGSLPGGNSMLVRWQYWRAAGQMIADHPVTGVGPGNFASYYTHYKPPAAIESVSDPHNFALSILSQFGPLGLLSFLLMLLAPLYRSLKPSPHFTETLTTTREPFRKLAVRLALLLTAVLLLLRPMLIWADAEGSTEAFIYIAVTMYVAPAAAFLIGLAFFAAPLKQPEPPAKTSVRKKPSKLSRKHTAKSTSQFPTQHPEPRTTTYAMPTTIAALFAAAISMVIANLIDFAIFEPGVYMTLWTVLACLIAFDALAGNRPPLARRLPGPIPLIFAMTALTAALAFVLYAYLPLRASLPKIAAARKAVEAGGFVRAHQLLEKAADADKLSPTALNFDARLYLSQYAQSPAKRPEPLENAIDSLRKAIARDPADYKNYEKLTDAYTLLDRHEEALNAALQAIQRYPGSARLHLKVAQSAENIDRADLALYHYKETVRIENVFRDQFRRMYPTRPLVSRLGKQRYQLAQNRINALAPRQ